MATMTQDDRNAVATWLTLVATLIFAMVVLGGVTRLTESGLSMTDWRPVTGWLPPLDQAAWQAAFDAYRHSPEYRQINAGMTLAEFKTIFAYEYAHRLLGRVIGIVFLVPFLFFLARGRLDRSLAWKLAAIFVLGGVQGGVGWFMVQSGLVDRPSVSQYRLAMHLGLAFLIYGVIVWTALGLRHAPAYGAGETWVPGLRRAAGWLLGLVSLTVISGAFVAGLDAGMIYNTFPLMGGHLVPVDWGQLAPWWRNLFENPVAVQFDHRVLALATTLATLGLWLQARRQRLSRRSRRIAGLLALMVLVQAGLGIATLLAGVPVWLGALHQAGALVLFTLAIAFPSSLRRLPLAAAREAG